MAVSETYSVPAAAADSPAQLRLERLELRNFKGVKHFTLEANGEDVAVYGDNAAGKTTLADGWSWLLFGKDSSGAAAFEIKTLDPKTGEPLHGLEHEVSATVVLPDGEHRELKKVYVEKWVKKRGSAQRQFSGHTTNHFVDGVPCRELEYQATVAEIADEASWRLLTDPSHFSERLHWQERRKLLLEVCGDVPDSDVIASKRELAPLVDVLGRRSIEDHRKVVDARRKEINRELDRLPTRIDEVERGKPDVDGLDEKALAGQLGGLRERRDEAAEKRASLRAGGAVAERTKEFRGAEAAVQEIETRARTIRDELLGILRRKATEASEAREAAARKADRLDQEIREAESIVEMTEGEMEKLRQEWHSIDGEAFTHEDETSCPTCGQDLPQQVVEEAHRRALAEFNQRKAKRLEEISARGKERKAKRDERLAYVESLREKLQTLASEGVGLAEEEADARKVYDREAGKSDPWCQTEAWQSADARRAALEEEIRELQAEAAPALEAADAALAELDRQIAEAEAKLASFEVLSKADARIEELKAEEQKLGAEFERLEHEIWMLEEFVRSKVNLLEERINARFEIVRFRLFKELVNGGLEECCEATVEGVPYGTNLNHGARVRAGLDIVRTLQEHFGIAVPIFVDQSESVTRLPEMGCQVVRLVVSASDKRLRVATGA